MIEKEKYKFWNILKQKLNSCNKENFYVNAKEIWYIHNGINIWYESNGKWLDFKRPVLVIKKVWNLFFIVSMTTKWKKNNKFYYKLDKSYFWKNSYVVLSQVKIIDKRRFAEQIWKLSWIDFWKIKKELKKILF